MTEPAGEGLKTVQLSSQEKAEAMGKWPCRQCGRFEFENCNGFSFCPHGRTRPNMLKDLRPQAYEACRDKGSRK